MSDTGDTPEAEAAVTQPAESAEPAASHARSVCEYLVRALVEEPDAVVVDESQRGQGTVAFSVRVGSRDMGRVIGKRGHTAHAIRTVVGAAAARDGLKVEVDFVD